MKNMEKSWASFAAKLKSDGNDWENKNLLTLFTSDQARKDFFLRKIGACYFHLNFLYIET